MKYLSSFKESRPRAWEFVTGPLATVARYLLAALFIFSGVSKAIGPFGLSIKLGEYFSALGLDFLKPLSESAAILMPAAELLIGLMLLTGISRRLTAWLAFIAMSFFTLLTLWLAIDNPISDCGCFGDLLKLSNWETFFKNLLFLPLAAILFMARNRQRELNPSRLHTIAAYIILIPLSLSVGVYSLNHLPLIDPTPFKTGVNIPHAMEAQGSEIQTILVYRDRESGKLHDFTLEDTTWYDTGRWEYVDTRTLGTSHAPSIKNVPMFEGSIDRSAELLERKGYSLIYVVNRYDARYLPDMQRLAAYIYQWNGRVVALSSTPLPAALSSAGIENLSSDNSIMRTMMQHRLGGALLLHDGTIIAKWPLDRLPQWQDDTTDPIAYTATEDRQQTECLRITLFLLILGLLTLASVLTRRLERK